MTTITVRIPRQRAVAAHRAIEAAAAPTAWGRTILLTVVAGFAGAVVQQSLVDVLGWDAVVPGLALAGMLALGGGR